MASSGRPRRARAAWPRALLPALCAALLLAGCGGKEPPRNPAPEESLEWARERFEEGDYRAAARGLEAFLTRNPLHPLSDSAQHLLGEAHFRAERYPQARQAFSRLVSTRPTSSVADDAQLGVCRSWWAESPDLPRDQGPTRNAVDACGRLLELWPDSELADEARRLRDRARGKLAAKYLRVGRWYMDHDLYESAKIYFEIVVERFPEAPVVPETLAELYRTYREMGFDSEAEQVRERLLREFGDSEAARELRESGARGGSAEPR